MGRQIIPAGKPATCDLLHKSPTMTNPALTRHGNDYARAGTSQSHPVGLANCADPAWLPRIQDPRDARGPILPPLFCSFVHNVPKGRKVARLCLRQLYSLRIEQHLTQGVATAPQLLKKSATFAPKYTDTLHDVACCSSRFALRTLW